MSPSERLCQTLLGAAPLLLPGRHRQLARLARELCAMAPGSRVTLLHSGPLAVPRLWWLSRRAGLRRERSYLLLPSMAAPLFLVERAPGPQSYLAGRLLTVPPRLTRGFAAASLLTDAAARSAAWRLLALGLGGELTVWRRE